MRGYDRNSYTTSANHCDKTRRKRRPKSNTKNTQQCRGAEGRSMFFVDLERVYQLLIYLSAAAAADVASTPAATLPTPRLTDQVYKTLGQNASDEQLLRQRCTRERRVPHQNKNLKYI